jgi:hypothetical protein
MSAAPIIDAAIREGQERLWRGAVDFDEAAKVVLRAAIPRDPTPETMGALAASHREGFGVEAGMTFGEVTERLRQMYRAQPIWRELWEKRT